MQTKCKQQTNVSLILTLDFEPDLGFRAGVQGNGWELETNISYSARRAPNAACSCHGVTEASIMEFPKWLILEP